MGTARASAAPDVGALVDRARSGDRSALDALVAEHLPLVYGVVGRALGATGARDDVDDVVQETMIRAVTALPSLDDASRFRSWLVAVAYRQVQEHQRGARRRPTPVDPTADGWADAPDLGADVAATAAAGVDLAAQCRALATAARWLDPAHRGVLGLWWQEACGELGRGDLARALGVGRNHAAVRVQRMRAQLEVARGVVAALDATPRCAGLQQVAAGWDGVASPLWRKRLDRHVRGCAGCSALTQQLAPSDRLVPVVGPLPVSAALAATGSWLTTGGPSAGGLAHGWLDWWHALEQQLRDGWGGIVARPVAAATAAAVVVGGGGAAVWVAVPHDPPAATAGAAPAAEGDPVPTAPVPAEPPVDGPVDGVVTADLYVAPDGSDENDGSYGRPFATLARAVAVVRPGQTIALRGGTYRPTAPVEITTDGAPGARITLGAYRDERPVLDLSAVPADTWPVVQRADRWTVQGLEVTGSRSHGWVCESCADGEFRELSLHDNTRSGMELRGAGTVGNRVVDSAFWDNRDPAGGGDVGIGLGVTAGSGEGNVVARNVFHGNADDGVDLAGFTSPVTLRDNESYRNGLRRAGDGAWHGNGGGFTLGGGDAPLAVAHVVEGNAAWGNGHHGFADGGNRGAIRLVGNSARDNGAAGFFLEAAAAVLRANTTSGNDVAAKLGDDVVATGNSWPDPA
ncbi:sigma-70 family RNA polymerase sigma factor [Isoptericola sp. F-RaC21]|uniref:sigma-70 family RNA polymerase sigma factor n=1 Tax=Isoptericola sp. F-RaC21 TaxID=3141452 RepID=UPI00315C0D80